MNSASITTTPSTTQPQTNGSRFASKAPVARVPAHPSQRGCRGSARSVRATAASPLVLSLGQRLGEPCAVLLALGRGEPLQLAQRVLALVPAQHLAAALLEHLPVLAV